MKLRLAPGKLFYFDPVSKFSLSYPNRIEGNIDENEFSVANLKYAVKTGALVEIKPKAKPKKNVKEVELPPVKEETKEKPVKKEVKKPKEETKEVASETKEPEQNDKKVEEKPAPKRRGRKKKSTT